MKRLRGLETDLVSWLELRVQKKSLDRMIDICQVTIGRRIIVLRKLKQASQDALYCMNSKCSAGGSCLLVGDRVGGEQWKCCKVAGCNWWCCPKKPCMSALHSHANVHVSRSMAAASSVAVAVAAAPTGVVSRKKK